MDLNDAIRSFDRIWMEKIEREKKKKQYSRIRIERKMTVSKRGFKSRVSFSY